MAATARYTRAICPRDGEAGAAPPSVAGDERPVARLYRCFRLAGPLRFVGFGITQRRNQKIKEFLSFDFVVDFLKSIATSFG